MMNIKLLPSVQKVLRMIRASVLRPDSLPQWYLQSRGITVGWGWEFQENRGYRCCPLGLLNRKEWLEWIESHPHVKVSTFSASMPYNSAPAPEGVHRVKDDPLWEGIHGIDLGDFIEWFDNLGEGWRPEAIQEMVFDMEIR